MEDVKECLEGALVAYAAVTAGDIVKVQYFDKCVLSHNVSHNDSEPKRHLLLYLNQAFHIS